MLDIFTALGESQLFVKVSAPIFLLGFLIFIHESGHFLFAKLFGVGVEKFSFGFGPKIFGFTHRGTEYRLSWIPLGGYVKMIGDDPFEEISPELKGVSFLSKPVWQRLLIVLAGPMFNLLLPVGLFAAVYMAGSPEAVAWAGSVSPESPAAQAGIQIGDRIVAVNDRPVKFFDELHRELNRVPLASQVSITVDRNGTRQVLPARLTVEKGVDEWGRQGDQNRLGIEPWGARPSVGVPNIEVLPAYASGLRTGDMIETLNGKRIEWWYQVEEVLRQAPPSLTLTVKRGEESLSVTVPSAASILLPVGSGFKGPALTSGDMAVTHPGATFGLFPAELVVHKVKEGRPAAEVGIRPGDLIYSIDGQPIRRWPDIKKLIDVNQAGPREITVLREGGLQAFSVTPALENSRDQFGNARRDRIIGIHPTAIFGTVDEPLRLNVVEALARGARETANITYVSMVLLSQVATGEIPLTESLGGPISIVQAAAKAAWMSIFHYVRMMVLISVSLGLINLLPIPLLDGGHILFFSLEFIRGKPVSIRFREVSQQVGLIILFILMAFAMANDVRNQFLR